MTASWELRQHKRFEVEGAIATLYRDGLLLKLGLGGRNRARSAVDLSEGGVRVVARERLSPGTKVRIRVELKNFGEAIEATGIIRWCRSNAYKSGEFFAGAMFVDLPPAQLKKIGLMRDCVTSLPYKAMRETRRQRKDSDSAPRK